MQTHRSNSRAKACRIVRSGALAIAGMSLTGCGVVFEATKLDPRDMGPAIPGEGIVYTLPRTHLHVSQVVKVKSPSGGPLATMWEACSRMCAVRAASPDTKACSFAYRPSLVFMNPALSTSSEPDPSQTYRVNARADLFQSLNVQVELGSTGIVEGVSSTSTNTAFELFSGIAQAIITASTFAAQGAPGKAPNPAAKSIARPEAQSDCLQAAKRVEELAEKGGGTLSCHEQQRIASCLKPMVDERDSWVLKRQELFLGKSRGSLKPEALAQVDGYLREQVSRAQTRLEGEQALFGLNPAKSDEATFRIKVPAGVPPEQKGGAFKVDLDDAMKKGLAAVEEQSEGASKLLPLLTKIIEAKKPGYVVTVSDPPAAGNIAAEAAGFSGTGGYRYRVPSISQVHVSLKPDASANDSVNTVVRIPIAQHGAVAALNSRFVGKGGKVVVKLWPDTGGLKTVEIGADALPTNVVTDVVDKLSAREKERRDAEKKASEDAAKADPELDAAKRERQLLEEKVKIQDLQKQFTGGQ